MKIAIFAALVLLIVGSSGCIGFSDWKTVQGSGNVTTEPRTVQGFDKVSVSGGGELTLVQGDQESLTVEADDNLLPYIRSEVRNGNLLLGPHEANVRSSRPIRYQLALKNLRELHVSGSVRSEAARIRSDSLGLHISGSGRVEVGQLEARALTVNISGSGTTTVAGAVDQQEIHISGSGDQVAPDLKSQRAQVHISGSGGATLWVTDALNAHISGSGRVQYRGQPSVDSHVSGSGKVRHMAGAE